MVLFFGLVFIRCPPPENFSANALGLNDDQIELKLLNVFWHKRSIYYFLNAHIQSRH